MLKRGAAGIAALALACALGAGGLVLPGCAALDGSNYTPPQGIDASSYTDLGTPDFGEIDGTTTSFEEYSPLDLLGRCGPATACLGRDLMPTREREQISSIKPSGWHRIELDFVDGGLLYNRCHLIAYSLAAEDLNDRNLITGTRQMNLAMTAFEQQVRDYVERTGNHVLYRVTPVFEGVELVARGVQMEALSVEDGGDAICFSVYIPNEQDGVEIDYLTGYARVMEAAASGSSGAVARGSDDFDASEFAYVLNTKSRRFHLPTCDAVREMSAANRQGSTLTREELVAQGYQPCGSCRP